MRIAALLTVPLFAGLLALPTGASAQISVRIGARLGPAITLSTYSPQQHGDWRTSYRQWRPVTVYSYNGQYYQHSVRGARPVQVYQRGNERFLPPQDKEWIGHDRRYNYRHRPTDEDYGRGQRRN
ncbi:MAG: hypothetical protein ABSB58_01610 [Gemmatimonadales bacterium]|jgi:hypothetical protein